MPTHVYVIICYLCILQVGMCKWRCDSMNPDLLFKQGKKLCLLWINDTKKNPQVHKYRTYTSLAKNLGVWVCLERGVKILSKMQKTNTVKIET